MAATITNTITAGKHQIVPAFASGNFRVQRMVVDTTDLTAMVATNTDDVTFADLPKGTIVLGAMVDVITATVPGSSGTCTATVYAGGASGTALTGAIDTRTAVGTTTGGAVTSNAYIAGAATTMVVKFATGTADNASNCKLGITLFLGSL